MKAESVTSWRAWQRWLLAASPSRNSSTTAARRSGELDVFLSCGAVWSAYLRAGAAMRLSIVDYAGKVTPRRAHLAAWAATHLDTREQAKPG
jgi:hypothetical protein